MACSGEDILNIDIDADFLIGLVGKLSLNNIPDFSETLQCFENNANIAPQENDASSSFVPLQCDIPLFNLPNESFSSSSSLNLPNSSSCDPLQCNGTSFKESSCSSSQLTFNNNSLSDPLQCGSTSSFDHPIESSCSSSLLSLNDNDNQSKDGFLSAIGLLSSPRSTQARNSSSSTYDSLDDSSNSCDNSPFVSTEHKESSQTSKDKQAKSKKGSSTKKIHRKVDFLENSTCDNTDSHWHNLPFFSGANFPHKSVDNLRDVFAAGGMVYDIQLSDIGSSSKLPFNACDEANEALSLRSLNQEPYDTVLPQPDKSDDLVEKSVCSPDSGISTSPCPGAVSPFSPQTDDSEEYDDSHYEDDLEILLAELIEIENSLKCAEAPQSNVRVPVLRDSKSAEDHKERILNFLKEPIFNDLKCQLSLLKGDDENLSFPGLLWETAAQSDCAVSSKTTKKPSPRSKKHKLGMEFKSAVKNELGRHSSIFSKGKHFSSRSKILKQIQDDERIQRQVKLIQKLIVCKKLKRIDIDDCENEIKKRRIHLTEPCDKPLEKLG